MKWQEEASTRESASNADVDRSQGAELEFTSPKESERALRRFYSRLLANELNVLLQVAIDTRVVTVTARLDAQRREQRCVQNRKGRGACQL